jgi:adenylate cyclase
MRPEFSDSTVLIMRKRQLAAIMFTDIVGYTSLMNSDERQAFNLIKINRRIHGHLIKKYRGRWLKEMGDGILASFSSNIDAIMCGLSIQSAATEMKIPLRIGIHQGDVVFEKNDVLGDGVNIASRIQGIADTNGIVISETVYNNIKNKEGIESEFLGRKSLKGIETEVGIYKLFCKDNNLLDHTVDTGEIFRTRGARRTTLPLVILLVALLGYLGYYFLSENRDQVPDTDQSVLILPFDNYTGTDTLDYFVAGMHDALIADIGKISALRVISKTTSNAYKNVDKSIPEIAAELGVNIVIEASVLCLGDSACLQIKAVGVYPEEKQLWVQDFKEEKSQILNLYYDITKQISDKINVYLTPQEESLLTDARSVDPEAYDAYLKGQYYSERHGKLDLENALKCFNIATEKDPTWALPYAGVAGAWASKMQMGFSEPTAAMPKIYENLNKALELDPNSASSHTLKALIAVWTEWDWEKGRMEFLKAIELNPNNAVTHVLYAHLLMILRRKEESMYEAGLALKLDPRRPYVMALYGIVMANSGYYQDALNQVNKALLIEADNHFAQVIMENVSYITKDFKKSIEANKKIYRIENEDASAIDKAMNDEGYSAAIKVLINILEKRYKTDYFLPMDLAGCYLRIHEYEKSINWLEKAYEIHDPNMPYITLASIYDELKDNVKFIALIKKMNLPVD